jgi:hypothetical protein
MYQYPSILGPNKAPHLPCIAFEKVDGSNLRWEWSRKRGWGKFGARHRLFDATDPDFGQAIPIFISKYAEGIEKALRDDKKHRNAESAVAFTEFFGQKSFAGQHQAGDPKDLVLFDVQVHKRGLLGPREFLDLFGKLDVANVVYEGALNASFVQDVRDGKFPNRHSANEGVVCKGGHGHELWMRKVKTATYIARLKGEIGAEWEKYGE